MPSPASTAFLQGLPGQLPILPNCCGDAAIQKGSRRRNDMPARPDRNRRGLGAAAATLLLTMVSAAPASAAPELTAPKVMAPELTTEDYRIPAADPGIELFIRNKRPAAGLPDPSKVVLYVHGATYPAETAFDLKLDGLSWMDFIAGHGWDVYLVDVRGY